LLVVFLYSKRCGVTFDPLLEFENKISYLGGRWCVATSMTPWCHHSRYRGLCHGVRGSKTDDSKFLKFGYDGEILPISVNWVAFVILHEDKCVKTTYELLIAMAELVVNGCSGRVISILESVDASIGERRSDASKVGDSGLLECLE
jgi:hypothetical protein